MFNHIPHHRALPRCGSFMDPRIIGETIPAAMPANPNEKPFRAYAKLSRPPMNHLVIRTVTA